MIRADEKHKEDAGEIQSLNTACASLQKSSYALGEELYNVKGQLHGVIEVLTLTKDAKKREQCFMI